MDTFVNLAKQGFESYGRSQDDVSKTGGSEYNRPAHSQHDNRSDSPDVDEDYAVKHAAEHGSGDESLFSSAMGFIKSNAGSKHEPVDEEGVTSAHKAAYDNDSGSNMSAESLGSAAALQAFKKFMSGSTSTDKKGGDSKSTLISMAMAEASKLFDKSGGTASGGKQDAVNSAAMTVMKLLVQSKFSSTTGGSNSGGLGSLLSMASKFA
ncbi:hypothetical protein ACEPAG_367 [Sanghuangporus baumii]